MDTANNVAVYHTDGLGSVRALTDGTGALVQTYQTDAFGVPTGSQGTSSQPFGFTGQQQDGDGLVYLRARYYDPATGRLLSRDAFGGSVADPSSLNRYTYAENNPGLDTDPSGHCLPVCAIVAAAACAADPACVALVAAAGYTAYELIRYYQQHPPSVPQISAPATAALAGPGSPNPTPGPGDGGGIRVALGLDDEVANLDQFAQEHDALSWKRWASPDPEAFRSDFLRVVSDDKNTVDFNLTGVDSPWRAATRAASGSPYASTTDWELLQIQQHPEWWNRITWWKNGEEVDNPFD